MGRGRREEGSWEDGRREVCMCRSEYMSDGVETEMWEVCACVCVSACAFMRVCAYVREYGVCVCVCLCVCVCEWECDWRWYGSNQEDKSLSTPSILPPQSSSSYTCTCTYLR